MDKKKQKSRKAQFIRVLAEYLARDPAKQSILLQMGDPHAHQWAKLRGPTPLSGYPTIDEAEETLREFLK